jgi:hypothetical protein
MIGLVGPLVLAVLVAAAPVSGAAPAAKSGGTGAKGEKREYDWCSPVVVRPDRTSLVGGVCRHSWTDEEIAQGAELVLLGGEGDVSVSRYARGATRCRPMGTFAATRPYIERLRALRAASGGPPLHFVHLNRFDLVADAQAALPGFRPDFLASTDRPWSEVEHFFSGDASPACDGGCRFSLAYGGDESRGKGTWLSDRIDAAGGPGRYRSVVYYLALRFGGGRTFWPIAALADLRNPDYRAWRVAEAKRAIEQGGYDAIDLNNKFFQYRRPNWIGSPEVPDVEALERARDEGYWTAPPKGYGYPEYVEGWAALARDLRAAGVPYSVALDARTFQGRGADDPSTPEKDEAAEIRSVARGARFVLLGTDGPPRAVDTALASLDGSGARVFQTAWHCGTRKAR